MNSPPNRPLEGMPLALRNAWEPSGRGAIEEYLEEFCLPLAEVLPEREVSDYRQWAREHLRDIEDEFRAQGMSEHFARHAALREHGDPRIIGRMLQNEYQCGYGRDLPWDKRSLKYALGLGALHTLFLGLLWNEAMVFGLKFELPELLVFLLSAPATGHISAAVGGISRWRGMALIVGAAFLAQTGLALLIPLSVWGVSEALFTLPLYLTFATLSLVKTARRRHACQRERLLRTLQKT